MNKGARFWLLRALLPLLLLAFAPVVQAGIYDSPLPVLQEGMETFHVYSVHGIVGGSGLATFFTCTSTDTVSMRVGVEIFYSIITLPKHNDPIATSLSLAPGGTVVFGTDADARADTAYSNLGVSVSMTEGSARILSTSEKLTCTAFILSNGDPDRPSVSLLKVLKQKMQKDE
jgi:hypothetical protein